MKVRLESWLFVVLDVAGSMDYISTLLIMEDDFDEENEDMGEFGEQFEEGYNYVNNIKYNL